MTRKPASKSKKRRYAHHSPAVSITVYDLGGRSLPERDVDELIESIAHLAYAKGYVINVART